MPAVPRTIRLRFLTTGGTVRPMPIRHRAPLLLPDRLGAVSAVIRFGRARGCCEGCGRPHGRMVYHLGDGRFWDADAGGGATDGAGGSGSRQRPTSSDGSGEPSGASRGPPGSRHLEQRGRQPLAAFCQRCHIIHDRPEHQRRRWRTLFRRKALGDLFGGPYT